MLAACWEAQNDWSLFIQVRVTHVALLVLQVILYEDELADGGISLLSVRAVRLPLTQHPPPVAACSAKVLLTYPNVW